MTKTIHVEYFALLREQRGLSAETVSTSAVTVADFYAELQKRHPFTLPTDRLRAKLSGMKKAPRDGWSLGLLMKPNRCEKFKRQTPKSSETPNFNVQF